MKSPFIEGGGNSFKDVAESLGECVQAVVRYIEDEQGLVDPSRFFLYGDDFIIIPYGITASSKTLPRGQVVHCLLFLPGNRCFKIDSDSLLSPWFTLEERIKKIQEKEQPCSFSGWKVLEPGHVLNGYDDIRLESEDIIDACPVLKKIQKDNRYLR